MVKREHSDLLHKGVKVWNQWRKDHSDIRPDLSGMKFQGAPLVDADLSLADLSGAELAGADLYEANLYMAELSNANLSGARLRHAQLPWTNLTEADLSSADLHRADLTRADLRGANCEGADFSEASLDRADLTEANLARADLTWSGLVRANLVGTVLEGAILRETLVYGVAAWDIKGVPRYQRDLVISRPGERYEVTIDDIEVAQFVYLLLHNEKVRRVLDAVTSKLVLILGRFTEERKAVLDQLRDELRRQNLVPVLFDFVKPANKDLTGTIETLARMARFIIADLTDPSSIPHELATIVPLLRTTPIAPLRLAGTSGFSMFHDLRAYPWVLPIFEYKDAAQLITAVAPNVVAPAEEKWRQLNSHN